MLQIYYLHTVQHLMHCKCLRTRYLRQPTERSRALWQRTPPPLTQLARDEHQATMLAAEKQHAAELQLLADRLSVAKEAHLLAFAGVPTSW